MARPAATVAKLTAVATIMLDDMVVVAMEVIAVMDTDLTVAVIIEVMATIPDTLVMAAIISLTPYTVLTFYPQFIFQA